jgi:hypothetical protein
MSDEVRFELAPFYIVWLGADGRPVDSVIPRYEVGSGRMAIEQNSRSDAAINEFDARAAAR